MYTMIDCIPDTPKEAASKAAAEKQKLVRSFGVFKDEACGESKGNSAKLNGATEMSGTVEECKLACWNARGAENCHGFTYNALTQVCKFVSDAQDGKVRRKPGLACYWKKT